MSEHSVGLVLDGIGWRGEERREKRGRMSYGGVEGRRREEEMEGWVTKKELKKRNRYIYYPWC